MSNFGAIPTEVICRFSEMTKTEIIVLSYLYAARNSKTGQCNPSRGEIARKVGVAKSHISPAVKSLEDKEWIFEHSDGNFQLTMPSQRVTDLVTPPVTELVTVTESVTVTDFGKKVTESVTGGYGIGNSLNKDLNNEGTTNKQRIKNMSDSSQNVVEVFEFWQTTLDHPTARLTSEREKKIKARLKSYSVEQIKDAILGCSLSPHHQGQNDRHQIYDDLELICRDDTHLEKFIGYGRKPKGENGKPTNGRTGNSSVINEWAEFARSG